MKALMIGSAILFAMTGIANAETFSFTGKNTNGDQIAGPGASGKPVVAGASTFANDEVWASGTKMKSSGKCMAWSAAPASGFTVEGICSGTDGNGGFFVQFSCVARGAKNAESDCWGGLTGTSGKYQGKMGTASWHGHQDADGKGSTSVGAGNWN